MGTAHHLGALHIHVIREADHQPTVYDVRRRCDCGQVLSARAFSEPDAVERLALKVSEHLER